MRWWNDLWLNEGFASFLEYLGVDHVMPGWSMMDQFILDKTQQGLHLDALSTSHPISVTVYDPVEIEAIFDSISYSKVRTYSLFNKHIIEIYFFIYRFFNFQGAAILYMLEKFLSQNILRRGLNDYLNIHKYGNADTKDLWSVLSKHTNQTLEVKVLHRELVHLKKKKIFHFNFFRRRSRLISLIPGLTLQSIMDTWTRQMGFPLVSIRKENVTASTYLATQTRFLLTSDVPNITTIRQPSSPFKYKWYIPLSYYTDQTNFKNVETVWMNMTNS